MCIFLSFGIGIQGTIVLLTTALNLQGEIISTLCLLQARKKGESYRISHQEYNGGDRT